MGGTSINEIEVKTGASIANVKVTSHGGLFYFDGSTQKVTFDTMKATLVESTGGEGGLLYSSTQTTNLVVSINLSEMTSIKAKNLGSMISLRKGGTVPQLSMTTFDSKYSC